MKLNIIKESNGHGQPTVFGMTIGVEELRLLYGLVQSAKKYTPKTIESMAICGRLRNFSKVIHASLVEYKDLQK